MLEKYPIHIDEYEYQIIIDIIEDNKYDIKHRIPDIWKQLVEKICPIYANSYEQGVLTGLFTEHRHKVPIVWKQLIDMIDKFRKDAGVEITDIGNNMVRLKDKQGYVMIRPRYEWEIKK